MQGISQPRPKLFEILKLTSAGGHQQPVHADERAPPVLYMADGSPVDCGSSKRLQLLF